jgi:hypothetical protein
MMFYENSQKPASFFVFLTEPKNCGQLAIVLLASGGLA